MVILPDIESGVRDKRTLKSIHVDVVVVSGVFETHVCLKN